jgi:hypothetical protein
MTDNDNSGVGMTEYSFSYNGTNYRGAFGTREEALSAALKGIGGLDVLPEAIYVGRRVPADPHASGLAVQLASLDSALECAVLGWLSKNDLLSGLFRIDSVSEHPAPTVPQNHTQTPAEVTSLGVEE